MLFRSGAFAISNNSFSSPNPQMNVEILYDTLVYNPVYSNKVKIDSHGNYYLEHYDDDISNNLSKLDNIKKIGAKIILNYHIINGKLNIEGTSNLPKGMELIVTLENHKINYMAQNKITILDNGNVSKSIFSDKNYRLKKGEYNINISSPYAFIQTESVQNIIGSKGQFLKSDITIEEEENFFIEYNQKINI